MPAVPRGFPREREDEDEDEGGKKMKRGGEETDNDGDDEERCVAARNQRRRRLQPKASLEPSDVAAVRASWSVYHHPRTHRREAWAASLASPRGVSRAHLR